MLCGYIGMMTAVKANVRVCVCCVRSSAEGFLAAFQGGAVMGFALCSIGLANLLILIAIMNAWLPAEADAAKVVPAFVGRFEVRPTSFLNPPPPTTAFQITNMLTATIMVSL